MNSTVWPLHAHALAMIMAEDEGPSLEFKRQWYDLARDADKAEMIRDILALANSAGPDQPALLVVGVEDRKRGGAVVGIDAPLDLDRITQILSSYVTPIPELRACSVEVQGRRVGVLGVFWTPQQPFAPYRDYGHSLRASAFYMRRNGIVGVMTAAEIDAAFRAKGLRLGAPFAGSPIQVGFISAGKWSGPTGPIVRFQNVTTTPITDVQLVFDVRMSRLADVFARVRSFDGLHLAPGESREAELQLQHLRLVGADGRDVQPYPDQRYGDYWLDVTARVRYRSTEGHLLEASASTFVVE